MNFRRSKLKRGREKSNLWKRFHILKPNDCNMHVRISELGKSVLSNKTLANRIADEIVSNKEKLEKGETVNVDGLTLQLTTTINEERFGGNGDKDAKSATTDK